MTRYLRNGFVFLFILSLCAACGKEGGDSGGSEGAGGEASQAPTGPINDQSKLVAVGLHALKTKNGEAYKKLLFTAEELIAKCPNIPAGKSQQVHEEMKETAQKLTSAMSECSELIDWSTAQEIERSGGKKRDAHKWCPDLIKHGDLKITYKVGDKKVQVKIDDPFLDKGTSTWRVLDAPRCREL